MIQFTRKAKTRQSELSRQRIYRSRCAAWKLIEVRSLVGLGRYWLAVRVVEAGEYVAARHRTRAAAEKRIQKLARNQ